MQTVGYGVGNLYADTHEPSEGGEQRGRKV